MEIQLQSSALAERRKKLPVIQERKSISHSEMMSFKNCQWRWHLDYEMGLRSTSDNFAFSFGDATHFSIESLLCPEVSERVSVDRAVEIFKERLYKRLEKVPTEQFLVLDEDKNEVFAHPVTDPADMAIRILNDFVAAPELRGTTIIANEMKIDQEIERTDGRKIRFKGAIDMLLSTGSDKKMKLLICDTKTCSWGWPYEKKRDENVLSQIMLYKHFICKTLSLDPRNVKTVFILLKKKPSKKTSAVEFFTPPSGPKVVERAVEMLQTTISEMMLETLALNRTACKNRFGDCPYLDSNLCPNQDGSFSHTLSSEPRYLDKTQPISSADEQEKKDFTSE